MNQIGLQLNKYDGMEAAGSAEGLRGTADNLLDIIDIVQNDTALNKAAGGNGAAGHAGGFAEMPGNLTGTVTHFQDNQAQTNFWAAFLSEANTINAQLTAIQNGQAQASQALVTQITNYEHFGQAFDAAQGAIFEARFDNELLSGTLEADSSNAIKGLTGILERRQGRRTRGGHGADQCRGRGLCRRRQGRQRQQHGDRRSQLCRHGDDGVDGDLGSWSGTGHHPGDGDAEHRQRHRRCCDHAAYDR